MKVIVIAVQGLNSGWLGCYGNEWISTPHLDRLASEGIVFDQHFADDPCSAGAIRSWQTGRYHALTGPHLFEVLSNNGIVCVGLRDVCAKDRPTVAHDWDILIETDEEIDLCSGIETFLEGVDPAYPALLWAETDQLLPPWVIDPELYQEYSGPIGSENPHDESQAPWSDPPQGIIAGGMTSWDRLRHSYAAVVTAFDEQMGLISERIAANDAKEPTFFIVTSGWGYPLGEHGFVGEGLLQLHEECIHVPLVMRLSNTAHAGRRISTFTQNIDLLPSILELFSLPLPANVQGRSVLSLIHRKALFIRPYAFAHHETSSALRTADWALLHRRPEGSSSIAQLFRKPHDRWEVNDLRQHHLTWSEYLESTLLTLEAGLGAPVSLELLPLKSYDDIVNEVAPPEPGETNLSSEPEAGALEEGLGRGASDG